jgi:hypothetical protein
MHHLEEGVQINFVLQSGVERATVLLSVAKLLLQIKLGREQFHAEGTVLHW